MGEKKYIIDCPYCDSVEEVFIQFENDLIISCQCRFCQNKWDEYRVNVEESQNEVSIC